MATTKISQYTHRPNLTELGMGNTHETYMLVNSDIDLSGMFPPSMEVEVTDTNSGKLYSLRSANGREFRINQMGELYRDYNILPGDEITISKIEKGAVSKLCVSIKQFNRVVLMVGGNGAEIVNLDRLQPYNTGVQNYAIDVYDRGIKNVLNISFKESKKKRSDSPNFTDYYNASINGNILSNGTYYLTLSDKNTIATLLKSDYNAIEFDDDILGQKTLPKLPDNLYPNSHIISYLTAIRTKPFLLLAGISGTGKSRIVRKLAQATLTEELHKKYNPNYSRDFATDRWTLHSPENFELIQVKPNWHNSMDVVGFKSNIGKEAHYEFTPFIEFIAKAWQHTDVPFFLCLDEMNLAPVEEYFAEFLSAIESRSINEEGLYETDPIIKPFWDFGPEVCGMMIAHLIDNRFVEDTTLENQFRYKGLTLPPNLIVMGTVNMDETTFSFSRKVLDRAMSIEMNEVSYDDFLAGKTEEDIPVLTKANSLLVNRPIKSQEVTSFVDADSIMAYLKAVNTILDGTPFKLGYRAANEAILYVAAAKSFKNDNIISALDDFTLMKVLSRIEGDDTKLKVSDVSKQAKPELGDELLAHLEDLFNSTFAGLEKCKSLEKLTQMINILGRDHFVSFWG